jgi:hypothetical protein
MKAGGPRTKGHTFERLIANAYRKRWPDAVVRRSQQSHKAHEPDVVVEDVPLWTECNHATNANPMAKLLQAERDTADVTETIWPVVVWRKTGSRTINATMRMRTLAALTGYLNRLIWSSTPPVDLVVTVDFADWLERVELP